MSTVPDFPARPAGRWISDDVYEFDAALEMAPGQVASRIDFSQMSIPEGISREQILEALSDPHRGVAERLPDITVDIPIKCPQCGKEGTGTLDGTSAMVGLGMDPSDEEDVEKFYDTVAEMIEQDGGALRDKYYCPVCTEASNG